MTETTFPGTKLFVGDASNVPEEMIAAVMQAPVLFVDTETTGLSAYRDNIALIQIHDRISNVTLLIQRNYLADWLQQLFARKDCVFVGHNLVMFDLQFLAGVYGTDIFELQVFDTLIAESLLSTSGRRDVSVSLRASVRRRVGLELDKSMDHSNWDAVDLRPEQVRYAVQDVLALVELYDAQLAKAAEQQCAGSLWLEMFASPVLARMSYNGFPMPFEEFYEYLGEQQTAAATAAAFLNETLGRINFNSPKQVINALQAHGLNLQSTSHDVLIDYYLAAEDGLKKDIVKALLDFRAPTKRASMYSTEWYLENVTEGKVHPLFWSIGADTLRMSSSKPNLQQVPKDARKMFGNVNGLAVVSVDYSQLEIRIAAAIAQDEALLATLKQDDVHTAIASQVFGVTVEQVTPAMRKASKAASFTLLFGGSAKTLYEYAKRSGSDITLEQANVVFKKFFQAFQGIASVRGKAYQACQERSVNVVRLPGGAKRVLVGDKNRPQVLLNTLVQATAAIGLKHALAEIKRRGLHTFLVAAVHDELVAVVPAPYAETYAQELSDAMIIGMQNVVACEIKVEAKIGHNWA
jgi:DNA polymerase-1